MHADKLYRIQDFTYAIVHNDYTSEVPPKFEFFDDRIEITSFGSLPQGLTESEFFEGYSVPRNKELMRIFRDLDLVEHLGSGVPRTYALMLKIFQIMNYPAASKRGVNINYTLHSR